MVNQNIKEKKYLIKLVLLCLLFGCVGKGFEYRELTNEESEILIFCGNWHNINYSFNDIIISTDISLCKKTFWGCYISYGLIVISKDLDNADIWERVKREDGTEAIRGLVIAHEMTHYLQDVLGMKLDHNNMFNENSCILKSREVLNG